MAQRTKKQHFVPRFYLAKFAAKDGYLWVHDSRSGIARRSTPENTGFETNIYSPEIGDGERFDKIEDMLAKIESQASPILDKLLQKKSLDPIEKSRFADFIACMIVRSPAFIRLFAKFAGEFASWGAARVSELEIQNKENSGEDCSAERHALDFLLEKGNIEINVDRRAGLMSFAQLPTISNVICNMYWNFEAFEKGEIITSDNPAFWVPSKKLPKSPYGFGLAHKYAVIPFPLSPDLVLRIDHGNSLQWRTSNISKEKAKHCNRLQAMHKENCLYYRNHHEGLHRLGMKYTRPVMQINTGINGPKINVVRKLKD